MDKRFSKNWLAILKDVLPSIDTAVFFVLDNEKMKMQLLAKWPDNPSQKNILLGLGKQAFQKQDIVIKRELDIDGKKQNDYFAYPIKITKYHYGLVIVKLKAASRDQHKIILSRLKLSAQWMKLGSTFGQEPEEENFYQSVVGLLSNCMEEEGYNKTLLKLVSVLKSKYKCEKVAFGAYHQHHCEVMAISNSSSFDKRSNVIQMIGDAMDEAIQQDSIVVYPQANNNAIQRVHQELMRKFGCGWLCTIPLVHEKKYLGAITLLCDESKAISEKEIDLCEQFLNLMSPILALRQEKEKSLSIKIGNRLIDKLKNLLGFKFFKLKLMAFFLISILIVTHQISAVHQVTASATLEGKVQRVVSSPISGYLVSVSARAGDTVQLGDNMASLDDSDLKLELNKLQGSLQKLQRQFRQAQSSRDLVRVSVVKEQIKQVNAEISLAKENLSKTNLSAPFNGIIIEGDLNQKLGSPVERGESLFRIAPLEGYRIVLRVPESDIGFIEKMQQGNLLLTSLPNTKLPLTVEKITAVSTVANGENIFRVEASLIDPPDVLRPGMEGVGKIKVGHASLLWIWTHRLRYSLSLWFWSWLP